MKQASDNSISLLSELKKTLVGQRGVDGSLRVEANEPPGCVLHGPLRLEAGLYQLEVSCRASTAQALHLPVLGLEAVKPFQGQLAWRDFTADELKCGLITASFFVPADSDVEGSEINLRFYHFGNAEIEITGVNLDRLADHSQFEKELQTWRVLGLMRTKKIANRQPGGVVTVKRRKRPQCFLDGPRDFTFPPGHYQLRFSCTGAATKTERQPVLGVEINVRDRYQVNVRDQYHLAWRDFTTEELDHGDATIEYIVPSDLGDHLSQNATVSIAFFHLGNSDLTVRAIEIRRVLNDPAHAMPQSEWRLLGRLKRRRRLRDIFKRRFGEIAQAHWVLHHVRPHLQLPVGRYCVCVDTAAASSGLTEPILGVEVAVQGIRKLPYWPRFLVDALRWRIRGTIATAATGQFTASELSAGQCRLEFEVPFERSVESGANVWFDLRLFCMSNIAIKLDDVKICAIGASQNTESGSAREPSLKTTVHRASVVVVGNCQAKILAKQLQALLLSDSIAVNFHFFNLPEREIEAGKPVVSEADTVLIQDIQDCEGYPLKEYIRDSARVIRFPCLRFASLWPFDSSNGPGDPEARKRDWPLLKFPYLDGALARLRKEISDPEARLTRYANLEMDQLNYSTRLHTFEERRLLAMDRKFKGEIGQYILDNFRSQRLFHNTGHPHGKLIAMLLDQVLRSIEIKAVVPSGSAMDHYFNSTQIPVHPMIGKILAVKWATGSARYLFDGESHTWETYVRRYIHYYG